MLSRRARVETVESAEGSTDVVDESLTSGVAVGVEVRIVKNIEKLTWQWMPTLQLSPSCGDDKPRSGMSLAF